MGRHPEQKDNEIFVINLSEEEYKKWYSELPDWIKSARLGDKAYKTNSTEIVKGFRPMFAVVRTSYN